MTLEVIFVTRHGFRSNWLVDHTTGQYSATIRTPTGIPSDPALTSHGVDQSKELATHLLGVQPPIDRVYSSPYYRCLQTISPYVSKRQQKQQPPQQQQGDGHGAELIDNAEPGGPALPVSAARGVINPPQTCSTGTGTFQIRCENGLSEWYGSAPFEHPTAAAFETLQSLFPNLLDADYKPVVVPSRSGESIDELHDRLAATMEALVAECDAAGTRSVLLCSHAAAVIGLGRVLTGVMPADVGEEDFHAFTCGLSVYRRRRREDAAGEHPDGIRRISPEIGPDSPMEKGETHSSVPTGDGRRGAAASTDRGDPTKSDSGSDLGPVANPPSWRGGAGVAGGWHCELDSDCSFLTGGEERGWRFAGDESFRALDKSSTDAGELGVVVEGNKGDRSRQRDSSNSHL